MTPFQIASLGILGVVVAFQFMPKLSLPKKNNTLKYIEQVIAIRDSNPSQEVVAACQTLLQSLLK